MRLVCLARGKQSMANLGSREMTMTNPTGESELSALRVQFSRRPILSAGTQPFHMLLENMCCEREFSSVGAGRILLILLGLFICARMVASLWLPFIAFKPAGRVRHVFAPLFGTCLGVLKAPSAFRIGGDLPSKDHCRNSEHPWNRASNYVRHQFNEHACEPLGLLLCDARGASRVLLCLPSGSACQIHIF
jgi:hypothetical protein